MNLRWEQTGYAKWRLYARAVDEFGWKRERTFAFIHEYRRHHKRRVSASVWPDGAINVTRAESKQFGSVKEAKAWAVAMCQLSQ